MLLVRRGVWKRVAPRYGIRVSRDFEARYPSVSDTTIWRAINGRGPATHQVIAAMLAVFTEHNFDDLFELVPVSEVNLQQDKIA